MDDITLILTRNFIELFAKPNNRYIFHAKITNDVQQALSMTSSTNLCEDIGALLRFGDVDNALHLVEQNLLRFPDDFGLLKLAVSIYHQAKKYDKSLQVAQQLISNFPDNCEGYNLLAEQLVFLERYDAAQLITSKGLEKFPNDCLVLYYSLVTNAKLSNYQQAISCGERLVDLFPDYEKFYPIFIECLYASSNADKLECILLKLPDSYASLRLRLDYLLWSRNYAAYRLELFCAISKYPKLNKQLAFDLLSSDLLSKKNSQLCEHSTDVDVICIASDEGPYIAEFVHHYLYLGFNNIYIGLNNSSDTSGAILEKISKVYPNVHVINVDNAYQTYNQQGCYVHLFNYARQTSASQYCLIVDIDEYWVADPFPLTISDFLGDKVPFDTYSFQWINLYSETAIFSPPLSDLSSPKINLHVKSICSYSCEYLNMRAHSPIIANISQPQTRVGDLVNCNYRKTITGYDLEQKLSNKTRLSAYKKGMGWILHRYTRSELEYVIKLFKPAPTNSSAPCKFSIKHNREGFVSIAPDAGILAYCNSLFEHTALNDYHKSLDSFLLECDILPEIQASQSLIAEDIIWERLRSIDPRILANESSHVLRVFSGTRFIGWISDVIQL